MHRFFLMARISCAAPVHNLLVLKLHCVCMWANYETSLLLLLSERCPCAIESRCPPLPGLLDQGWKLCAPRKGVPVTIKSQGAGGSLVC